MNFPAINVAFYATSLEHHKSLILELLRYNYPIKNIKMY